MTTVIDLHCHVLPGIDDGPDSINDALALVRDAERDGIDTIAATPHIAPAYPANDAKSVQAAINTLQPRIATAGIKVTLVPGGELDALHALTLSDAELTDLHLGHGEWLLFECPLSAVAAPVFMPAARELARRGHRLLLAHPERSPLFLKQPAKLDELIAEGMLAQVTAGSLSGQFGSTVRALAHDLLERRMVQVVASDAHGAHRPASIGKELEQAGIAPEITAWLANDVPRAILNGSEPPAPPSPTRRRLFGR